MIHCIGDSHVSVFSGIDKITDGWPSVGDCLPGYHSYRTGPHLAYSVGDPDHVAYRTLRHILNQLPSDDTILLSYGEVDCRVHVVKQAEAQNKSLQDIVNNIVWRYSNAILSVRETHSKVIVYAPVASCNCNHPDAKVCEENEYPHIGPPELRNFATKAFSKALIDKFENTDIGVLSIFDQLSDDNLKTIDSFYMDSVHLSQKAMPLLQNAIQELVTTKWSSDV
jgi:hypothetical protein